MTQEQRVRIQTWMDGLTETELAIAERNLNMPPDLQRAQLAVQIHRVEAKMDTYHKGPNLPNVFTLAGHGVASAFGAGTVIMAKLLGVV